MKTEINFCKKPVLEGEKVILRPFEENDWETMLPILSEPELRRLTGSVVNEEEANASIGPEEQEGIKKWYQSRNQQTDRLDLAVIEKESKELVGEVVFNMFEESTGNVNFRILISASGCNKGLGSEATELFLRYGFEVLELHKIELEVFSFNPRAQRVYRKCGFLPEGMKRESIRFNDEYYDTYFYGMLKADYENIN